MITRYDSSILLLTMVVVLAGCSADTAQPTPTNTTGPSPIVDNTNTTSSETSGGSFGLVTACPDGMRAFSDNFVYFCYPDTLDVDVDGERYFIYDPAEDETLIRELALGTYEEATLQEYLTATYVNPDAGDKGVTCDFAVDNQTNGKWHSIIGYPTGDPSGQDLESVTVCRDTDAYAEALEELPAEEFFEPTTPNGYYLILNGEQDVLFGEQNAAFLDSISLSPNVLQ